MAPLIYMKFQFGQGLPYPYIPMQKQKLHLRTIPFVAKIKPNWWLHDPFIPMQKKKKKKKKKMHLRIIPFKAKTKSSNLRTKWTLPFVIVTTISC